MDDSRDWGGLSINDVLDYLTTPNFGTPPSQVMVTSCMEGPRKNTFTSCTITSTTTLHTVAIWAFSFHQNSLKNAWLDPGSVKPQKIILTNKYENKDVGWLKESIFNISFEIFIEHRAHCGRLWVVEVAAHCGCYIKSWVAEHLFCVKLQLGYFNFWI